MIEKLFSFLPWRSPGTRSVDSLEQLRFELLASLLLTFAIFTTPVYLVSLISTPLPQEILRTAIYTLVYLTLLSLTFLRGISYPTRAAGFTALIFLAGIATQMQFGINSLAYALYLGAVFFSILLLGYQGAFVVGMLSAFTVMIPWLAAQDWTLSPTSATLVLWMMPPMIFLVLVFTAGWAGHTIIQGLVSQLNSRNLALTSLEAKHTLMMKTDRDLSQRLKQLQTVGEVARISSAVLEPDQLYQQAIDLIRERFNLYYAGLFLLDERGEYAVLRSGTGEAGRRMVESGHRLAVGGSSMVGWAIANQKARIALDTGEDAIRFENPHLPHTRSELALPLLARKYTLGALTIQSTHPRAFDEDNLHALQGMADSLAIAIQNARLFQDLQTSLKEIETLNRQYMTGSWSKYLQDVGPLSHTYINPSSKSEAEGGQATAETTLYLRGQMIGRINLESSQGDWDEKDINLIEAVALQASQALDNARLIQETQYRAENERRLGDISARLRETLDVDYVLRTAAQELLDALKLAEVEVRLGHANGAKQAED
jgi:GAF domain-containing protein